MRWSALGFVFVVIAGFAAFGGCATSAVIEDEDGGTMMDPVDTGVMGCTKCGTTGCFDLKTDSANCGKCGTACPMTATCVQGSCQCPAGQTRCGNTCVDTKTDIQNCGKCGTLCGNDAGQPNGGMWGCAGGACSIMCAAPKTLCDDTCVDLKTDSNNCGMCLNACMMTESCLAGMCCPMGNVLCNNACTNTQTDPMNCGMCGKQCGGNTPGCQNGVCSAFVDHGPMHTFTNLTTDHYITQGGCSVNGNDATDAQYFCTHFYGNNCTIQAGYKKHTTPNGTYGKMHKNGGCTGNGNNIPNTTCDQGACKIGNWNEVTQGLNNLICRCL